jgi:signal transduction histidine kinase
MKSRSWMVLLIGFGILIALIVILGLGAKRRAKAIYAESLATHEAYLRTDAIVRELPANLHLSGILVRDYLLDPSHLRGPYYREQLRAQLTEMSKSLELLRRHLSPENIPALDHLTKEVTDYWDSLDPVFEWSPPQKSLMSAAFLRKVVVNRRDSVVKLAQQISQLNLESLAAEQTRLQKSEDLFQGFVRQILLITVVVAVLVSMASILWVNVLDGRHQSAKERAENAEHELRQLSRKLVKAQEEERRALSRELHDALGQKLSFIGMELSTLSSLQVAAPEKFASRLDDAQRLITETVRNVRDLSMTLRPAMLDELGLGSAVRWQGREFARRSGIDVDVQLDGELDGLPDLHRTAIYRIVQEALTNCAKHARAKHIRIALYGGTEFIRLTVQDDGVGFSMNGKPPRGLGLIGMEERVRELGGTFTIMATPNRGTMIEASVPLPAPVATTA